MQHWSPILEKEEKDKAEKIVFEIADSLNDIKENNFSLISGRMGITLFFFIYLNILTIGNTKKPHRGILMK